MNAFQVQLQKDIDCIFLNPEEFGEYRKIGGKEMLVVVDRHKLAELKEKTQYAEELYTASVLLYVRPGELGYRPAKGAVFTVDDDCYRVIEVSGDALYRIILEAAE